VHGRVTTSSRWAVFRIEYPDCRIQMIDIAANGANISQQLITIPVELHAPSHKAGQSIGPIGNPLHIQEIFHVATVTNPKEQPQSSLGALAT
jgi:hypothetical protein